MRLDSIQALRGAACLLVVLFHAAEFESAFGLRYPPLRPVRWFGYAGVDLFFVISGFVIAYAHRTRFGRPAEVPGFLLKRLWRIYPTYWAALALTLTHFGVFYHKTPLAPDWQGHLWPAVSLAPGPPGTMQPWVPQAWTLAYELAFYLTFAGLLALPKRLAVAGFVGWAAVVGYAAATDQHQFGRYLPLWTCAHVGEFLAGVGIGLTVGRPTRAHAKLAAVAAGVWLAAGLAVTFDPDPAAVPRRLPVRAAVFGPAAALIVFAAAAWDLSGGRSPRRWLVAVGEASYSVYLIHLLTQAWWFNLWGQIGLGHGKIWHPVWQCGLVLAAVAGGYALHRAVERPVLNLIRRKPKPAAEPAAAPELRRAA